MNLNQLVTMILRQLVQRGLTFGIAKGSEALAKRGRTPEEADRPLSAEERRNAGQMRQTAHQARRLTRMVRRFLR